MNTATEQGLQNEANRPFPALVRILADMVEDYLRHDAQQREAAVQSPQHNVRPEKKSA